MFQNTLRGKLVAAAFAIGVLAHVAPTHAALLDGGDIVTLDGGGASGRSRLIRIEPVTGARTVLHDFSLGAGPIGGPSGGAVSAAIDNAGQIYVIDVNFGAQFNGGLFRVTANGVRQLVSDWGVGANPGKSARAVA